jgi:hypothetical protein
MSDIITRCERHGIVNREPTPRSITYVGNYQPGNMRYCPYCGRKTTIEWPDKEDALSWSSKVKDYMEHREDKSKYLPPWEE